MLKVKDARRALCGKGFKEDRSRDHCYYFYHFENKKSHINTKISHGETELNDYLCTAMAKQIRLTKTQFTKLIECDLTAEAYQQLLFAGGHIKAAPGN